MAEPGITQVAWTLLQVGVLAVVVGWAADKLIDTGLRIRGLTLAAGLIGLHAGSWVWGAIGWPRGPSFADHPLIPAFAGALAVCAVLKLFGAGVEGSRG
jgi:uncharacterized membrane protein YeaQ/YmgE (transglycosylase-associated protein family)